MSKRRLILGSVMYLMLLPCSILVLTACVSTPNEIRDPFEKVIGARLDPLVQLVTNRDQYSDDKPVVYQVVNRKTVPVYFPDYSYGIQAYVYDQQSQKWKLFPWKFGLNDPKPAVVAPGTGRGTENTYVIDMVSMPPSGKVRLVVVGWLDPTNPEGSKIAAFTDIEIVR